MPEEDVVSDLTASLRLPRPLCSVLAVRGFDRVDVAKRFLRPLLEHLHDPETLADGTLAAERIARAIRSGESILVHGDYDVDGICATALTTRWLRGLGGRVTPFVPHRMRDGYDFSEGGLEAARRASATLVVTADCGTLALQPIARARAEGIDVIVTDHHTVGPQLPEALAVVNPQRPDCTYPFKGLCGTAVTFKLCQLVARALGADESELFVHLDLVALATVADLVPLADENRVLVSYGLRRLRQSRSVGLRALLEAAGVPAEDVTAGKLGFVVAPRINAAGRIGESADALRLLLTEDRAEAEALAEQLDGINTARQNEDRRTLEEALEHLEGFYVPERDFGVVLAAEGWHPGVIGIVASRIVERIHRPVVLIALDGPRGRGSARSIPGFHLHEALSACAQHMLRFGGHKQAAGMDVSRDAVPALREAFNAEARARLGEEDLRPVLRPDLEISPVDIDLDLVRWLDYLGPHGIGNPGPLFQSRSLMIEDPRRVGDRHLKALLRAGSTRIDAIGFGMADRFQLDELRARPHDVLFRVERNDWRGVSKPQARLVDLRPAASST